MGLKSCGRVSIGLVSSGCLSKYGPCVKWMSVRRCVSMGLASCVCLCEYGSSVLWVSV